MQSWKFAAVAIIGSAVAAGLMPSSAAADGWTCRAGGVCRCVGDNGRPATGCSATDYQCVSGSYRIGRVGDRECLSRRDSSGRWRTDSAELRRQGAYFAQNTNYYPDRYRRSQQQVFGRSAQQPLRSPQTLPPNFFGPQPRPGVFRPAPGRFRPAARSFNGSRIFSVY